MKKSKFEWYGVQLPDLVKQAIRLAEQLDFPVMPKGRPVGFKGPASACIPEVGQLLSALIAAKPGGRIAEHGTGAGIGTAWMASAMLPGTKLISAEIDARLAEAARQLFQDHPGVEIRSGDCMDVLADEPPFDLVFMDAGARQYLVPENWDNVVEMVKVGGQIVVDDLMPLELWPPQWDDLIDQKREFAFHNPRVVGAEVRTTKTQAALIMTRLKQPRSSSYEQRYLTTGLSAQGRHLIVAHTDREGRIRIISTRELTKRERKFYEEGG